MAKVVGGLFSVEASGKFANAIIFDRRGYVRTYKRPTNPQTAAQGDVRQVLLATQRAIPVTGSITRTHVKTLAPVEYRWNAFLVQQVIGKGKVPWNVSLAAFDALPQAEQDEWTAEAAALGIVESHIPYAGNPPISAGAALYILARTLHGLGIYVDTGAPDGSNAAAWAGNIIA